MKKTIIHCSFIGLGLVLILIACLFVVKIDFIKTCYFINDDNNMSLIVDKKTNDFITRQKYASCILMMNEQNEKAHLVYDQYVKEGYEYWINLNQNDNLAITQEFIKCNFGKEILIFNLF